MSETERANLDSYYLSHYNNISLINTYNGHSSTNLFNCHGYSWHVSERGLSNIGEYRQIGGESIYWSDNGEDNSSYKVIATLQYPYPINIPPPAYPGKISYEEDHSAVMADPAIYPPFPPPSNQNDRRVISKWGPDGPLVCHTVGNCPYFHINHNSLTFYHLNPKIIGDTITTLCNYTSRTFTTDITHMPVGALKWTHGVFITEVGVDNSYQYTVRALGAGPTNTNVALETKTLSLDGLTLVHTWGGIKHFPVNASPIISEQKVDGITYQYGMGICPGYHWLSVAPFPHTGDATTTWTVPSGIIHGIGPDHNLGFLFTNNLNSITITVSAANTPCGTGSISNFYLTKKTSGCQYGMTLYPNPASDNVTVTMTGNIPLTEYSYSTNFTKEAKYDADAESNESTTYTIRIYNNQSTLLSTCNRSGWSFDIPLNNMKNGAYIIEVSNGENSYRQLLIVKHN